MMKELTLVIFFLCIVLFEIKIIKSHVMNGLLDDESSDNECRSVAEDVAEMNKNTEVLSPHSIIGKWVSEKCESRAGPKFVLRSYTFYSNNTFQLIQFYYNDESCSSVTYTVTMVGRYKLKRRSSFSFAAPNKIVHDLRKVTIVAHDFRPAFDLANALNEQCPGLTDRHWKPFVEYVIFLWRSKRNSSYGNPTSYFRSDEINNSAETSERRSQRMESNDRCLAAINLSLDELDTVRIQSRYTKENGFRPTYELLLANAYYTDQHLQTLRHKFQLPLILVNGSTDCLICDSVAESTNMFVRPLTAKAKLPLYVNGEWISERCEVLSTELFSRRTLRLHQLSHKWELQTSYYSDYICSNIMMVHRTFGYYFEDISSSKRMPGAFDITFSIDKSYLTVFEESILHTIRSDPFCGVPQYRYWQIGVTREIPSRTGCATVGIANPLESHDIARLDIDDRGAYLLYLGDEGSSIRSRPTAYKYPLLRCSPYIDEEQLFNLSSSDTNTGLVLPGPSSFVLASVFYVPLFTYIIW